MNKVILMGRLVRDPEMKYGNTTVAKYTLAVDRRRSNKGEDSADFINCVVFSKAAEFADKYLHKGSRILITGRIQTGSYTNKDGQKIYTTDVVVEDQEFAESKNSGSSSSAKDKVASDTNTAVPTTSADGFMSIPDGIDSELPFN